MNRTLRPIAGALWLLFAVACGGGGASSGSGSDPQVPAPGAEAAPDRIVVELVDPDDDESEAVQELREDFAGVSITRIGTSAFYELELPDGTDLDALLADLDDDFRVVTGERDYVGGLPEGGPSDAPILGSELFDDIPVQASLAPLDLPGARAVTGGAGVVVAVVDTGIDFGHPYLAGRLLPEGFDFVDEDPDPSDARDGVDRDGDGLVDEQYGHGTFVASLVLTVAPDARVLPVRVLDADGIGTSSSVAAGIRWAVDRGAHVINVSVDIPNDPRVVKDAVEYAEERDVVVIAASGNKGLADVIFPARYSDVMAVAAVDAAGVRAPFSNASDKVSLAAPGVELLGAVPQDRNPFGTARWSGTSFASPLVAGSAALVRAAFPGFDRSAVRERLESSALPLDAANPDLGGRLGAGLVQPARAVAP